MMSLSYPVLLDFMPDVAVWLIAVVSSHHNTQQKAQGRTHQRPLRLQRALMPSGVFETAMLSQRRCLSKAPSAHSFRLVVAAASYKSMKRYSFRPSAPITRNKLSAPPCVEARSDKMLETKRMYPLSALPLAPKICRHLAPRRLLARRPIGAASGLVPLHCDRCSTTPLNTIRAHISSFSPIATPHATKPSAFKPIAKIKHVECRQPTWSITRRTMANRPGSHPPRGLDKHGANIEVSQRSADCSLTYLSLYDTS
ncbi:hypothetical protein BU26DRAFT_298264 [Trematosphaeria pertusa]|uniref:Uncharacterized protein n=1 Tax=Trematosphaeria pertusa TaxID=390896 RepID=A0A6A6IJA1_9PLEO|nr:uncharacterized protein BU26DRAFT_298264 [Trematosphaeria pertusa]KAF2250257.1 hypothetical protein BU26DRAFT_298264 [Trematosphaeria pertusa]